MRPFKERRLSAIAMLSSNQTATATDAHTQQQQPPSWFAEHEEQMRLIQLDRGNMSRQLQEIAGQVEQNKQDLKRLSRFFGVKHRSNIRVLKACGRRKMCELLQADFSADHAKGWDQFLMSLTGSDCKTLEAQGFTQDALKGTATNAYEKLHGCATHEQADLLIADAVANLPEAVRQQYIALFDAVYGKHAFDMLEHEMQDEDSG